MESKIQHKSTYLWDENRLTDVENRLVSKEWHRGGKDWKFGITRERILYIGWVNDKVLLYSAGNRIQYPVTNHNGKEYEK